MKYANKLSKKDIKVFLTYTKLKDYMDKFKITQDENHCVVSAYLFKHGTKQLNFKLYLTDFDIRIESIGGGYFGLFSTEYQDKIRLGYKYFMSYVFGDKKEDYAPYKRECIEYLLQEYQIFLNKMINLKKIDADAAENVSKKLCKELFTFKQDAVPDVVKRTLAYLYDINEENKIEEYEDDSTLIS